MKENPWGPDRRLGAGADGGGHHVAPGADVEEFAAGPRPERSDSSAVRDLPLCRCWCWEMAGGRPRSSRFRWTRRPATVRRVRSRSLLRHRASPPPAPAHCRRRDEYLRCPAPPIWPTVPPVRNRSQRPSGDQAPSRSPVPRCRMSESEPVPSAGREYSPRSRSRPGWTEHDCAPVRHPARPVFRRPVIRRPVTRDLAEAA